jgi:hypothetical protein
MAEILYMSHSRDEQGHKVTTFQGQKYKIDIIEGIKKGLDVLEVNNLETGNHMDTPFNPIHTYDFLSDLFHDEYQIVALD